MKAERKKKGKRVKCVVCKKPIHIKDFGGVDFEGLYHSDCIVKKLRRKIVERVMYNGNVY